MTNKDRRRQYVVDRRFQFGLAWKLFICLFVVAFISGFVVYYSVSKTVLAELHGMHLSRINHAVGLDFLLYGLFAIVAFSLLSIFVSHRIAGPARKMSQAIDRWIEDDTKPDPIQLRRNDALHGLAASLNRLFIHGAVNSVSGEQKEHRPLAHETPMNGLPVV